MKFGSIAAICMIAGASIGASSAEARTADVCYQVKCTGTRSICMTLVIGHNMEVGFPGVASWKVIPCPPGKGTVSYPYEQYQHVFIHDPIDQSMGLGLVNGDATLNRETGEGELTKYDDSQIYADYTTWHNALP